MNKIAIYVAMILLFLGLSKSFSPTEENVPYLMNEKVFPSIFTGGPLTVILEDSFYTGLLIKTYFQKYRILKGLNPATHMIVRTTRSFWEQNLPMHGMSLFRRGEYSDFMSIIPMPPGTLYLGDPAFGKWSYDNSGERIWKFHYAYREFPEHLGWGKWAPGHEFYVQSLAHERNGQAYYGPKSEFGINGSVTRQTFTMPLYNTPKNTLDFKRHISNFIKVPFKKLKAKS